MRMGATSATVFGNSSGSTSDSYSSSGSGSSDSTVETETNTASFTSTFSGGVETWSRGGTESSTGTTDNNGTVSVTSGSISQSWSGTVDVAVPGILQLEGLVDAPLNSRAMGHVPPDATGSGAGGGVTVSSSGGLSGSSSGGPSGSSSGLGVRRRVFRPFRVSSSSSSSSSGSAHTCLDRAQLAWSVDAACFQTSTISQVRAVGQGFSAALRHRCSWRPPAFWHPSSRL